MKKLTLFLTLSLLTLIGTSTLVKAESDTQISPEEEVAAEAAAEEEVTAEAEEVVVEEEEAVEAAAE